MTAGVEDRQLIGTAAGASGRLPFVRRMLEAASQFVALHVFSSLTRRIIILNLVALFVLVAGIIYLNQFRAGLIDAKVQSLATQGEIIARAIAASAGVDTDEVQLDPEKLLETEHQSGADDEALSNSLDFTIDPERAAPILRPLVKPTGSRARI